MRKRQPVRILPFLALAASVSCASATNTVDRTPPLATVNGAARSDGGDPLVARIDSLSRALLAEDRLAGLSVAVLRGRDTLLFAYGYADVGLAVPVTPRTTFRLIGPGTYALGAALMQQVEAGRLRLDDDAARLIPDFPWQGRRVTVRQLMDATSGLPDFHYLGDAHMAQHAVPKAQDEVTALFAGIPFTHEPGEQWQWTISGFHLAGGLLERLSGQRWADYIAEHISTPLGLERTVHCDDVTVVPGLARGYQAARTGFLNVTGESSTMYAFEATLCGTALEAATLVRALRDGRLIRGESWRAMSTAEGAAASISPTDSAFGWGFGISTGIVGPHRWYGDRGSLMGYSSAVMDFPDADVTIVVLTNTDGRGGRLSRRIAHAILGVPAPEETSVQSSPTPPVSRPLRAAEHGRYIGTYRLTLIDPPGPYRQWVRTMRVFDENGRLMLQALGSAPEPLLYLGDDTFATASEPQTRYVVSVRDGRAASLAVNWSEDFRAEGPRVEDAASTGSAWPLEPAASPATAPTAPTTVPPPAIPAVPAAASSLVPRVTGVARRFVDVPGARLQWLDFGGQGETVVLLPGLGNTAWTYSEFGTALARQGFRVVALTRRAHGESEAPAAGYDMDSLMGDILAFMDSVGVPQAHLVGHSFAGAEMTWLAARHPDRVRRLVYLDAAYDRQAHAAFFGREPDTGTPVMTAADHASPAAYLAYQRRARPDLAQAWGPPVERDWLASFEQQADGSVRWRHPFQRYYEMFLASAGAPPEYARVRAPSLAVYAQQVRTSWSLDLAPDAPPAQRDSVAAFERDVAGPWVDASIAQFRAGGENRCVVRMDAIHHVFLQRERETVALVRDFLRGRPVPCG